MIRSHLNIFTKKMQQPAPINEGENVPKAFQAWAWKHGKEHAVQLSKERDAFGQEKYGQPLMTGDGRDTIKDITDELGDGNHYLYKAIMMKLEVSDQDKERLTELALVAQVLVNKLCSDGQV